MKNAFLPKRTFHPPGASRGGFLFRTVVSVSPASAVGIPSWHTKCQGDVFLPRNNDAHLHPPWLRPWRVFLALRSSRARPRRGSCNLAAGEVILVRRPTANALSVACGPRRVRMRRSSDPWRSPKNLVGCGDREVFSMLRAPSTHQFDRASKCECCQLLRSILGWRMLQVMCRDQASYGCWHSIVGAKKHRFNACFTGGGQSCDACPRQAGIQSVQSTISIGRHAEIPVHQEAMRIFAPRLPCVPR